MKGYSIPESVGFLSVNEKDRERITRTVTTECKKCVIGALYNDFEGKLYAFDLCGDGAYLSDGTYRFISKYKMEIERLNYYAWARFLEIKVPAQAGRCGEIQAPSDRYRDHEQGAGCIFTV